jgi:tight adherence protein C
MSSLWLAIALVGTFFAIFMVGVVVDMLLRERHRPVTLLQSQLGQVPDHTDFTKADLEGSLLDRLVMPGVKGLGRSLVRLTPFDLNAKISQLLVLAGNPSGWDAERVVALKILGGVGGTIGGVVLMPLLPVPSLVKVVFLGVLAMIGYTIPSAQLRSMANGRQKKIQRQLPDVMDLLTISVEAGLGLDAAMVQVINNVPGPLSQELARLSQEINIGVSRSDAFRHLGERTTVQELRAFVLSMVQADLFGVSIANVLRAQSRELRLKRRQRAEEIAQKIPVKLLFPMIFLVLPATFIVILGPGMIKIYDQFFGL